MVGTTVVNRLAMVLLVMIVAIQYPLWFGRGGWFKVWELDARLSAQRDSNRRLELRNAAMDAEVRDLKHGLDAIEERARVELGMVREDEVFYQSPPAASAEGPTVASTDPSRIKP
jgi:cell division protein FtsB